jgi:hypothetical protein
MQLKSGLVIRAIPNWSEMTGDQKAFIVDWIGALRSGNYKQATGVLQSIGGAFCCLGVAVDLQVKAGKGVWSTHEVCLNPEGQGMSSVRIFMPLDEHEASADSYIPTNLAKSLGLCGNFGMYVSVDQTTWPPIVMEDGTTKKNGVYDCSLADLNDSGGATFEEIALILTTALKGGYLIEGLTDEQKIRFNSDLCRNNHTPPLAM